MQNTLVIIVDFINEIVNEKGAFGIHNAQRMKDVQTIQNANKVIEQARNNELLIVHVKVGFGQDYKECPKNSPMFGKAQEYGVLKLNTWATDFHKDMDVRDNDIVITKHRVSALYGTNLEVILRANSIDKVVICGVSTNYVIESTVRELHDRDYMVTVIADACNASSEESHNASLKSLERIAKISSVDEFLSES